MWIAYHACHVRLHLHNLGIAVVWIITMTGIHRMNVWMITTTISSKRRCGVYTHCRVTRCVATIANNVIITSIINTAITIEVADTLCRVVIYIISICSASRCIAVHNIGVAISNRGTISISDSINVTIDIIFIIRVRVKRLCTCVYVYLT